MLRSLYQKDIGKEWSPASPDIGRAGNYKQFPLAMITPQSIIKFSRWLWNL